MMQVTSNPLLFTMNSWKLKERQKRAIFGLLFNSPQPESAMDVRP
jgi:hypothetical protein